MRSHVLHAAVPPDDAPELTALARFAAENLRAADPSSPILACLDMTELPGERRMIWRSGAGSDVCLLTQSDDWRKAANASIGFPAPSETHGRRG